MRFLIVDDDCACRELLHGILSPYAECDLVGNGREAVESIRRALASGHPYDLICLDIMMPEVDGHEALQSIRQVEKEFGICGSDGVKVIMTTALHSPKDCIRSFREGCESFCTKPIKGEELLREIRNLLGRLPRAATPPSGCPSSSGASPISGPRERRFLIVDDDRVCRELLREMLSRYGECSFAYDGQEAIDAVRLALEDGLPYDLVTLDIMMPGTDGHAALRAIRTLEQQHGIHGSDGVKIIMTTALRDSKHCVRAFREGCECYISKPVSDRELLAAMKRLEVLGNLAQCDAAWVEGSSGKPSD